MLSMQQCCLLYFLICNVFYILSKQEMYRNCVTHVHQNKPPTCTSAVACCRSFCTGSLFENDRQTCPTFILQHILNLTQKLKMCVFFFYTDEDFINFFF